VVGFPDGNYCTDIVRGGLGVPSWVAPGIVLDLPRVNRYKGNETPGCGRWMDVEKQGKYSGLPLGGGVRGICPTLFHEDALGRWLAIIAMHLI